MWPFMTVSVLKYALKVHGWFQEEKIREEEEAIKRKAVEEAKKKEAMAAMSMNYSGFMAKKQVSFQVHTWAEFREISTFSFWSLNCHFWGRITKIITRVNPRIFMNSFFKWFSRFPQKWP